MDPKLIAVGGSKAPAEWTLTQNLEAVIGRDPENAIFVPDAQVSRRHAAIRPTAGRWFARDLGSANGTQINGRRILAETPIGDGDVLSLGGTKLQFVDPSEPRTVRDKPLVGRWIRQRFASRKRLAVGGVGALLIAGLGLAVECRHRRDRQLLEGDQRRVQRKRQQAEAVFQRGKNLIRAGDWVAAKVELDQLARLDPGIAELSEYLKRAEGEIPNQQALAEAEAALGKGETGNASAALARVATDTLQYERLAAIQARLAERTAEQIQQAQAAFEARDYARSAALAEAVLRAFPASSDARYFAGAARRALEKPRRRGKAKPAEPRVVRQAVKRFLDGDVAGAASLADGCAATVARCAALAIQLREFQALNHRLDFLDLDSVRRLVALDRKIAGAAGSSVSEKAKQRLSAMLQKLAGKAQSAQEWAKASRMAQEAIRSDPRNVAASVILDEAKGKAREIYLSAYAMRETEPAAALVKFKEVLQLTSPGDENYQRARFWIEKLSR